MVWAHAKIASSRTEETVCSAKTDGHMISGGSYEHKDEYTDREYRNEDSGKG